MRAGQLFIPTLRTAPADAEAASHKLLVRGGFIRQVASGVWTFLPLGWRVHQRIVRIIREEIDAIGGQEMLCPALTPAELWQQTGRYDIPELFKLEDRAGRPFVLPFSHEETFTFHAREIQSYKQLPQVWYHFATKERDEPRSRGALIRVREFMMKDSYSLDRDDAGLDEAYENHRRAYASIFERCGLDVQEVEAEVGMMGGSSSHDFLAPAEAGENELVTCENGDYAADADIATGVPHPARFPERLPKREPVETPGAKTIEAVAELLGVDPRATLKAMPVVSGEQVVLALVRGDDRLDELKLATALRGNIRPAQPEEITKVFGADGGSIGPVEIDVEVVADKAIGPGQYVVGANRNGWHLRGVEPNLDFQARFADIRAVREGDSCPRCGGQLSIEPAIEVGHIFKLGTRYSEPLGATYLDESGVERPIVMGSYGIGPGRVMAAVVEQRHDEDGIVWPQAVAPFDVHVIALQASGEGVLGAAEAVEQELAPAGYDILLDDRDLRAGEKFADADLIGCPARITVGKKTIDDGAVDLRSRATGDEERVPILELKGKLAETL